MTIIHKFTSRAQWLVPASVIFCLLLLAFDLLAFWALGRRPIVSTPEANTLVWSLLVGSAANYAARWLISHEPRVRHALAATLAVMVLVSALHPWLNGLAIDGTIPQAPSLIEAPEYDPVVFNEGPLSEAAY